jgi:2-haloacid dehalogenase
MLDLTPIRALTFDCYGTLIDWERGLSGTLNAWAQSAGVLLRDDQLLELYAKHESSVESESPSMLYSEVVKEAMRRIATELGSVATTEWIDRLGHSVGEWPAFPDTAEALIRLHQRFQLCILSNVDHASFAGSARKLIVDFDLIVTAQDAGSYKPSLNNFHALLNRLRHELGIEPKQVLHVAQSLYHDHVPAQSLGLKTVWIDRRHHKSLGVVSSHGSTPPPPADVRYDAAFPSMREFAAWAMTTERPSTSQSSANASGT